MTKTQNVINAHMAATAFMGVTMNNVQQCATPESGFGGGDININITTKGNLVLNGMDLSQTSNSIVNCFYDSGNQASLSQSLSDTLTAMAENEMGLLDSLVTSALSKDENKILTDVLQDAVQKVQVNNMQTCGVGSSDINVNIDTKGNAYIDNLDVSNNAYSYLSCVFSATNVENMSQQLAAVTDDSAVNTKKDPFSGLGSIATLAVGVVIFIGLVIAGFIVFRVVESALPSRGGGTAPAPAPAIRVAPPAS